MLNYIYPLCINNNTGKIDTPFMERKIVYFSVGEKMDDFSLTCEDKNNKEYTSYTTIYTLSPEITPLPYNTEFYCFKYDDFFPYNIIKFSILRDPFMKTENCVIFIAWRIQVKNTIPLYIYKTGEGIKVSLKKVNNDYLNNNLYILKRYPPVFVMSEYIDKFICEDKMCIPDKSVLGKSGTDIISCIIDCCVECNGGKNIKGYTLSRPEKSNTKLYLGILLFLCIYILILI